ncbi:hypothetical protein [Streptomyces sp. NBC_00035]|uniref:hypothetical protein n=1 Tax=Streptomyces sp. NBC_00035 TaxID=2903614 RepID=UPI003255A9B6
MAHTRCPGCPSGVKGPGKYLCFGCWNTLPTAARRLLNRRDSRAMARLRELYDQITTGVPLHEIEVSP